MSKHIHNDYVIHLAYWTVYDDFRFNVLCSRLDEVARQI